MKENKADRSTLAVALETATLKPRSTLPRRSACRRPRHCCCLRARARFHCRVRCVRCDRRAAQPHRRRPRRPPPQWHRPQQRRQHSVRLRLARWRPRRGGGRSTETATATSARSAFSTMATMPLVSKRQPRTRTTMKQPPRRTRVRRARVPRSLASTRYRPLVRRRPSLMPRERPAVGPAMTRAERPIGRRTETYRPRVFASPFGLTLRRRRALSALAAWAARTTASHRRACSPALACPPCPRDPPWVL